MSPYNFAFVKIALEIEFAIERLFLSLVSSDKFGCISVVSVPPPVQTQRMAISYSEYLDKLQPFAKLF
jgi:hypothetical protein